jgi:hypothetical protein
MLTVRSDGPSAADLSAGMAVFQSLITDALTVTPPSNDSLTKRDDYSSALDTVNSIFDTIYGVADGSIPVTEGSLGRRALEDNPLVPFIEGLCKLVRIHCSFQSAQARDVSSQFQFAVDTLNAWAEDPSLFTLDPPSDFTPEDALEVATVLQDIVIAWRTAIDRSTTSESSIAARSSALMAKSILSGIDGHLDKRGITREQLKAGLHALAAAINFVADIL